MVLKNIGVSEHVKAQLEKIKKRNGHTSFDSVIRYLLMKSGKHWLSRQPTETVR